jgi:hypothetical protein
MPAEAPKSPAVESLEREHAEQAKQAADDNLEEGLEETFPASDPVSATRAGNSREAD